MVKIILVSLGRMKKSAPNPLRDNQKNSYLFNTIFNVVFRYKT